MQFSECILSLSNIQLYFEYYEKQYLEMHGDELQTFPEVSPGL
jgi:hypothetical protein